MALKIKNIATSEVTEVKNTGIYEGKLFVFGKGEPTRWVAKNPMFALTGNILASGAYNKYELVFVEGQGYELVSVGGKSTTTRGRKPRAQKAQSTATEPATQKKSVLDTWKEYKTKHPEAALLFRCGDFYETYNEDAETCADVLGITLTKRSDGTPMAGFPYHALNTYLPKLIRAGKRVAICDDITNGGKVVEKTEPKQEPTPKSEPKAEPEPKKNVDEMKKALLDKYGKMGADVFEAAVEYVQANYKPSGASVDETLAKRICESVLEEYAKQEPKKVALAVKAAKKASGEYYCKDFDDILEDVKDGYNVYLHGAAGSGKTHTAEQIAEKLGLEYYTQTTIQFAHDVRGYGDAGGNYQDTPFYKAFSGGGLYFQDEYDRSYAEAAIVLNTALANGYYDFPIVGRVKAHPNFRFMAAGNTLMKGADDEYVTGQTIDASSRDRFGAFYECEYNHEVELNAIAKGDATLVAFVEDVRKAIKSTGVQHIVSYRATAYMVNRQKDKAKTLVRNTFKGLLVDDIRVIYGALTDKNNVWAKAMKSII